MPSQWGSFPAARPYNPAPAYYPPPPQQSAPPPRRRVIGPRRLAAGIVWGIITGILAAGAVGEWVTGIQGGAVVCLVLAAGTGWFDYRIWRKPRARRPD